ncbi:MAG: hypothetical protein RL637_463 [Pseudomonadota bacterium]|jgi:hypothetical protein
MNYPEKLENNKQYYPFDRWQVAADFESPPCSEQNCQRARTIMDDLIRHLIDLGEQVSSSEKIEYFKVAVEAYNYLNEELKRQLIDDQKREELFILFNQITLSIGLDPQDYGYGEGLASEWCDW